MEMVTMMANHQDFNSAIILHKITLMKDVKTGKVSAILKGIGTDAKYWPI